MTKFDEVASTNLKISQLPLYPATSIFLRFQQIILTQTQIGLKKKISVCEGIYQGREKKQ